jgi:hypothetical protein
MMVAIAWNPLELHLLDALPKGNTFNAKYRRVNILTELLPPWAHRSIEGDSLVILTIQDLTSPENTQLLRKKPPPPCRTPTVLT